MKTQKILIVEDEQRVAHLLRDYLERDSFEAHCLYDGGEVIEWIQIHTPDLILLDQMLPLRDGLSLLREIRTFSTIPVIIATAKTEEIDRLLGLETGADDYVCKPFSYREVVARVKAVLRRGEAGHTAQHKATPNALSMDEASCSVDLMGTRVPLTVIEFNLLQALARRPGTIFSRDRLMDLIYSDQRIVSDRTIDSHIRKLRQKLNAIVPDEEIITSVYSAGYKLNPVVLKASV